MIPIRERQTKSVRRLPATKRHRILAATLSLALGASLTAGCGGGGGVEHVVAPQADTAGHAASVASRNAGRTLTAHAAEAVVQRTESATLPTRVASLRNSAQQSRRMLEPICMRLAAAQQHHAGPDEQLYALLSDEAKRVHSHAAFVDLGHRVAALTHGQTEVLLDAWCA